MPTHHFPTDNDYSEVNFVGITHGVARDQLLEQMTKGDGYFPGVDAYRARLNIRKNEILFTVGTPEASGYTPVQSSLNGFDGVSDQPIPYIQTILRESLGENEAATEIIDSLTAQAIERNLTVMGVASADVIIMGRKGEMINSNDPTVGKTQGVVSFPVMYKRALPGQSIFGQVPTSTQAKNEATAPTKFDGIEGKVTFEYVTRDRETINHRFAQQFFLYMKDPMAYILLFKAGVNTFTRNVVLAMEQKIQTMLTMGAVFSAGLIDVGVTTLNPLHASDERIVQTDIPGILRDTDAKPTSTDYYTNHRTNIPDLRPNTAVALAPFYRSVLGHQSAVTIPRPDESRVGRRLQVEGIAIGAYNSSDFLATLLACLGIIPPSRGDDGTRMGGIVYQCFLNPYAREAWCHIRTFFVNRMMGLLGQNREDILDARYLPFSYVADGGNWYNNTAVQVVDGVKVANLNTEAGRAYYQACLNMMMSLVADKALDAAENFNYLGTCISGNEPGRTGLLALAPGKR